MLKSESDASPLLGSPLSQPFFPPQPISACRHRGGDSQQKQCDIMVGSKKTTIYAIDPTTGKVRWTQDPMGSAGGRGYTAHPPKSDTSQGRTVLLQREDYAVRQLDTEGGEQVMKVELGKFSALDFDVDVSSGDASSSGHPSNDDDDVNVGEGSDHFVGGRRRGAAAEAASKEKRKSGVPPILGRRNKATLHDFDSDFGHDGEGTAGEGSLVHDHDDFEHDPSQFRVFPSIALSEVSVPTVAKCPQGILRIAILIICCCPFFRTERVSWQSMATAKSYFGSAK